MSRLVMSAALLVCVAGCRDAAEGVRTQFVGSYPFTATERRTIARIAGDAEREARALLPMLPAQITLQVTSGSEDVIPEVGAGATVSTPEFVRWTVDPNHPDGVVTIAATSLRQALLHEFMHLVRYNAFSEYDLMGRVVNEGLATAFERDVTGVSPPWGQYPDDVKAWVEELMALPAGTDFREWMSATRPDGRRWVGMRAGTYIVDRAMKNRGRSVAALATMPAAEIIAAAGFKVP